MKSLLKFLTWPTVAGVLLALLILERWVIPSSPINRHHQALTNSYAEAVQAATASVVNIYTAKLVNSRRNPALEDRFFQRYTAPPRQRQRIEQSLGSGVIMSASGHILTNNHVISGADAIQVLLHDGRTASATVVGTDQATDLAVLKIDLPELQPVTLADSTRAQVGDVVLAIGNPLGFGHSVTQGIISALGRYGLQNNPYSYEDYIQTDAIIHLGNSGGALIDTQGKLLGINTLFYAADNGQSPTGIGISLAIPVNLAEFVMHDLIEYGEVIRGWLGVSVEPMRTLDSNNIPGQVLAVRSVADNGPAARAGVEPGDIITHLDGEVVRDGRLAMHRIALLRPGDTVAIGLLRGQQSMELQAVLGALRQSPSAAPTP
jgi:serine protease DegS